MNNSFNLIKQIAGSQFVVSEDASGLINVTHSKCGNQFQRSVAQISMHGLNCPRCNAVNNVNEQIITSTEEMHALNLYNACKKFLPQHFILTGDTSDEDNVVEVSSSDGNMRFSLKIRDILENRNLPDCLMRRDASVSGVHLDVLDTLLPDELQVLDNFDSLDSVVRVKNNKTLEVKEYSVRAILEGVMGYE